MVNTPSMNLRWPTNSINKKLKESNSLPSMISIGADIQVGSGFLLENLENWTQRKIQHSRSSQASLAYEELLRSNSLEFSLILFRVRKISSYLSGPAAHIQMMKICMTLRELIRPTNDLKVPESYLSKVSAQSIQKDYFIKENYSGLTKSKSKQSARDLNSISGMSCILKEGGPQKSPKKHSAVIDSENPTILKLNSIFNSLFGKRTKQPMKTYTEGMIVRSNPPK